MTKARQTLQTIHFCYDDLDIVHLHTKLENDGTYGGYSCKVPMKVVTRYRKALAEFETANHELREAINAKLGKPFRYGGLFFGCSSG